MDVQIIAATNLNLKEEVAAGSFREDLFYRLNIVSLKLPSLRERREDIPLLIDHFIKTNRHQINHRIKGVDSETLHLLMNYSWPGNVRQLNNVIERMMILADGEILIKSLVPHDIVAETTPSNIPSFQEDIVETLDVISAKYAEHIVKRCNGNIKKAAQQLGISRGTLYRLLKYLREGDDI